jgi:hypothetical protein
MSEVLSKPMLEEKGPEPDMARCDVLRVDVKTLLRGSRCAMTRSSLALRAGLYAVLMLLHGIANAQTPVPLPGTRIDVDVMGNIFVLDARAGTLTLYDRGMQIVTQTGGPGWENGRFDEPAGLWARNGLDVFVADFGNHRVQRFDRSLSFVSSLSTREAQNPRERIGYPTDVALSRLGDLFVCDTENIRIAKVNAQNQVEFTFGDFGAGRGRLSHPTQVEIGPGETILVLDPPRVVLFDSFGNFISTLPEPLLTAPSCLFADQETVALVDSNRILCFDKTFRPAESFDVRDILGFSPAHVFSLAIAGGRWYLLTEAGLSVFDDPRDSSTRLDKETKTH